MNRFVCRGGLSTIRRLLGVLLVFATLAGTVRADAIDEMSVDRWKKLREAERYQLNIAERFYREGNFKVALSEYEKFLSLHEKSEGASYAQLKWSICQVQVRKLNTAIKEGFQSVIDYWPDSPEATSSAYLIARTYKDMGDIKLAKKAYGVVMERHPKHLVSVLAKVDLADIARIEMDDKRRVALWQDLVYETPRTGGADPYCRQASIDLAHWQFSKGSFPEALRSLTTTFTPEQLPYHISVYGNGHVQALVGAPDTKVAGEKMADEAVAYLKTRLPVDLKAEGALAAYRAYSYYMSDMYWYSQRPNQAKAIYDELLAKQGVDDDTLARLAGWFKGMNRRDEARAAYGRYLNQINGQAQIAASYREPVERKYDLAVPIYRDLIQRDVKNANQWQGELAHSLREAGHYKEAIGAYRLWDSFPNNYWHMAQCHRALKETKEAILLYQQIAAEKTWASHATLQIGYTHEEAGDKEKCIKSLQLVCKRYPKSPDASQAHAYLQDKYKINQTFGGDTGKDE